VKSKELKERTKKEIYTEYTEATGVTEEFWRASMDNGGLLFAAGQREGRAKARPYNERLKIIRGAESPLWPSPLEEPGLPPPRQRAFCCFSRASRMRALRDRRTLLPRWRELSQALGSELQLIANSRMRCSEDFR